MKQFRFLLRSKYFMLWHKLMMRDIYEKESFFEVLQHEL